jgi:hypothetical protein
MRLRVFELSRATALMQCTGRSLNGSACFTRAGCDSAAQTARIANRDYPVPNARLVIGKFDKRKVVGAIRVEQL